MYEAVVGDELYKDNFNRRMKPMLEPVLRGGEPVLATQLRGRPAALYRKARSTALWPGGFSPDDEVVATP